MKQKHGERKDQAIALRYDGKDAPRVVAKGEGYLAEQIIRTAQQHAIPMMQDRELAALLAKVDLGDEIPASLYLAVAQVLAFTYYLKGQTGN